MKVYWKGGYENLLTRHEKQVFKIGVHEHICYQLPNMESSRTDRVECQHIGDE